MMLITGSRKRSYTCGCCNNTNNKMVFNFSLMVFLFSVFVGMASAKPGKFYFFLFYSLRCTFFPLALFSVDTLFPVGFALSICLANGLKFLTLFKIFFRLFFYAKSIMKTKWSLVEMTATLVKIKI